MLQSFPDHDTVRKVPSDDTGGQTSLCVDSVTVAASLNHADDESLVTHRVSVLGS